MKIIFGLVGLIVALAVLSIVLLFPFLLFCAVYSLFNIPLSYILGNMKARRTSLALSILGIGVVIAVMLSMKALDRGVTLATQSTASKDILLVMREGAEAEISSWVTLDATRIIRSLPGVAKNAKGEALVSPEGTLLFKLPREGAPKGSNVLVRGVSPIAFEIRPYVKLVEGRMFRPASNELVISKRIAKRFHLHVGETFVFGPHTWSIVGAFEAPQSAYDSEIWADINYLREAQHRGDSYSSVYVQPVDRSAAEAIKAAIKNDNRLKLQVRSEYQYYADQSNGLIGIKILVFIVTIFMTFGAILGTMNTMFSSIAPRQRELATLRALGFNRRTIIGSVVIESAIVAFLGALAGLILSLPINGISTGTVNWSTFSEIAFNFHVDTSVALFGFVVAFIAGVYGGSFPAIRAARMPIPQALREI
jgi:ABC-type lipoprotein release transport system permease subunit